MADEKKGDFMEKTIKFNVVFGVTAGYEGLQSPDQVNLGEVMAKAAAAWQEAAAAEFAKSGLYISAVAAPAAAVYHTDWGCPVGGEIAVSFEGTANPQFVNDIDMWKHAVIRVVTEVKTKLKQSTTTLEFSEVNDFYYITD